MLLAFEDVREAMSAAFAIQHASKRQSFGVPPERQILLRIGIEITDVIMEGHDIYGHGVNLATRLASVAGPSEIVISARVRDQITPVWTPTSRISAIAFSSTSAPRARIPHRPPRTASFYSTWLLVR